METILNNLKNYKDIAEKKSIYYNEIDQALIIVKEYIKQKKLIIYGGLAIDIALKLVGHPGIYQDDVIPDFDVYSSDFYNDSNSLAVVLHEKKMENVSAINAVHFNSRRVRVNYQSVCDFSYIPASVFNKLPYIEVKSNNSNLKKYNGLRIIHPDFQRLDLHRAYNIPYANSPQEVILHRLEKDAKRFRMLNEKYMLPFEHLSISDTKKIKVSPEKDVVYSGLFAYAIVYSELIKKIEIPEIKKALKETGLDVVINELLSKVIILEYDSSKENIVCPKEIADFCYVTKLTKAPLTETKYYYRFLDNLRPPMTLDNGVETFYIQGEKVPYYQVDNIKIAASNGILLYLLQKHFETGNKIYAALYNSFLLIIAAAEKIVLALTEKNPEYLNTNYESLPFFLPATFYGEHKTEEDIPRPPFGFYPAKADNWPEFDLNNEHYKLTGELKI